MMHIDNSPKGATKMPNSPTDNEIKKALECCIEAEDDCSSCPLKDTKHCVSTLCKNVLDFINRLQAKNNGLQELVNLSIDTQNDLTDKLLQVEETINRQEAEIKRLKRYYYQHEYDKWEKEIKAEAYKECLGKIEQRDVSESDFYIMIKKSEFNNLLNELLQKGENNDD